MSEMLNIKPADVYFKYQACTMSERINTKPRILNINCNDKLGSVGSCPRRIMNIFTYFSISN